MQQCFTSPQKNYQQYNILSSQYQKLKQKLQNQIKKNTSLLKMNNNLMQQNELFQNVFMTLKKWSKKVIKSNKNYENEQENEQSIDESVIDIQQGQDFINSLIQEIEKKFTQLTLVNLQNTGSKQITQQTQFLQQPSRNQTLIIQTLQKQSHQSQCSNCQRWKQLYMKQTKQTSRLQKLLKQSALFKNQKQTNMIKLKEDINKLLQDYWLLYRQRYNIQSNKRKQYNIQSNESKVVSNNNSALLTQDNNDQKIFKDQTIRPNNMTKSKSKQKKPHSKQVKNQQNPLNPFSKKNSSSSRQKQKTIRQPQSNVYSIQLSNAKQNSSKQNDNQKQQESYTLQGYSNILTSYSECYKKNQEQLMFLKDKFKQSTELLAIYREKERNRILYR